MHKRGKQKLIGPDNSMVVTTEGGVGGVVKCKGDELYGDGRLFDFGWWPHTSIYRSCITECTLGYNSTWTTIKKSEEKNLKKTSEKEMHTWNLYNYFYQCYQN